MNKDIVYNATISTSNANDTKHYIGMTSSTFKERYRSSHVLTEREEIHAGIPWRVDVAWGPRKRKKRIKH